MIDLLTALLIAFPQISANLGTIEAKKDEAKLEIADAQLKSEFDRRLEALIGIDSGLAEALTDEQRSWISYRNDHCRFVGLTMRGVLGEQFIVAHCKLQMTIARTKELNLRQKAN